MRNHFSGADLFVRPSDCSGVTFRDRLVIRCCGQSCSKSRADRQVLQKTLGGRQFLFRNPVYEIMKGVAAQFKLLTLAYCNRVRDHQGPRILSHDPVGQWWAMWHVIPGIYGSGGKIRSRLAASNPLAIVLRDDRRAAARLARWLPMRRWGSYWAYTRPDLD